MSLLDTLAPLPVINFPICPSVHTSSVRLSVFKESVVTVVIRISFEAFAVPFVTQPSAFVLPAVLIAHHTLALSFALTIHLSVVELVITWETEFCIVWL